MIETRLACEQLFINWGYGRAHIPGMLDAVPPEILENMVKEENNATKRELYNNALADAKASIEGHE